MAYGYEGTREEEEFYKQMQYEAALEKIRGILYDGNGNIACPICGCIEFVPSDEFGVLVDADTGLVKCCNCGTVCSM